MSSSSSSLARNLLGVVVEVAALSISGAIAMSLASRLLHPRRAQRSAPSREHKLAIRSLKGKQQPLNDHEAEVASDVVCPTDVGCSFADVGGLQKLAEELRNRDLTHVRARYASSTAEDSPNRAYQNGRSRATNTGPGLSAENPYEVAYAPIQE